jgi:pyruvate dehydrogenase E2 component (dihydrolipoamide acetyltransferase)
MSQSKTTVPHFYVTIEADVTALMALREQLNASWTETRVGVEDMVVKALGIALTEFPIVNASWQNDRLVYHQQVNVGVALAVENGLLVPVLHDVQAMSLRTLSQEIKELRRRARDNQAQTRDFQGGTFTVSNLGPYGVDEFLAIVNPPESGILALGAVERKPVARGDQVVISQRMRLSLSADHRVYYGATAAQFLGRVRELLEKPLALLA